MEPTGPDWAPARLLIDLDAIAWNYRRLAEEANGAQVAAVVKANGYGLGIAPVAKTLAQAGARVFFTAHLGEAITLRSILPDQEFEIGVLNGLLPGEERVYLQNNLFPVLNAPEQIRQWQDFQTRHGEKRPAALQIDTGMARLGLSPEDTSFLIDDPDHLKDLDIRYLMSHMACADDPAHPINRQQLSLFEAARKSIPHRFAMLAASSASFLGHEWHADFIRPGVALFGGRPRPDAPNPFRPVIQLKAKILQTRLVDAPQTVGYGATFAATEPTRVATVAVGYADGYLRSLSSRATAFCNGTRIPILGRVSMDVTTFDVTRVPKAVAGDEIDLICHEHTIDDLADEGQTIGYEILTSLGHRFERVYTGVPLE